MSKFRSKKGSEDKGRARSRSGKRPARLEASEEKKGYKAKRSFSKNKSFREAKADRPGERPFKRDFDRDKKKSGDKRSDDKKSYGKDSYSERPYLGEGVRSKRNSDNDKNDRKKTIKGSEDKFSGFKRANAAGENKPSENKAPGKRRFTKPRKSEESTFTKRLKYDELEEGKGFAPQTSQKRPGNQRYKKTGSVSKQTGTDGLQRLNKYLSNAGIASRRDADDLIISGAVKVNGIVVDKLGTKIGPNDKVTYGDASVKAERKVYLLLNKPKDYITTVEDPKERKTVMELIKGACKERIYPVGRLDRNTTGLLLFTNDGEMTTKLTHPKFGVKKIYHVSLNKGLKSEDFHAIVEGLELEDGLVKVDDLAFVGEGKKEIGIEIHSGRNRIVRRIFEHLGYDVLKLDRVVFAGLTKKDLPRGKHRFLTGKEISFLQMIG